MNDERNSLIVLHLSVHSSSNKFRMTLQFVDQDDMALPVTSFRKDMFRQYRGFQASEIHSRSVYFRYNQVVVLKIFYFVISLLRLIILVEE